MLTHVIARLLVMNDRREILLLVRSRHDSHRPGGYDLPGGKIDDGETYAEAAVRETREEAGLHLAADTLQLLYATSHRGIHSELKQPVSFVWLGYAVASPVSQPVVLSHEHQAYEWCGFDDAADKLRDSTAHGFLCYLSDNNLLEELR